MRISTISLSSCCGCHVALVNLGEDVIGLLAQEAFVFSPVLMDTKAIPESDVALVEGSIRNQENIERLKELRERTRVLIAFGTCATFGGVPGMGSAFSTTDLLAHAYGSEFTPDALPALEKRVYPIDAFVQVDYYLSGCPPAPAILKDALTKLLNGEKPQRMDLPVCADCERRVRKTENFELHRTANSAPEPGECLLSQGYICLGSVSRNGCGGPCPAAGVPCMGCRGPVDRVLTEASHGTLHNLTRRISNFTGKSEKEVKLHLKDILHTFYGFTLSSPELRRKDAECVSELIHRISV